MQVDKYHLDNGQNALCIVTKEGPQSLGEDPKTPKEAFQMGIICVKRARIKGEKRSHKFFFCNSE